jgi:hypothetical protein
MRAARGASAAQARRVECREIGENFTNLTRHAIKIAPNGTGYAARQGHQPALFDIVGLT